MIANLYLHPDRLKGRPSESQESYSNKLSLFVRDLSIIVGEEELDDNKIIISNSLTCDSVFEDKTLFDIAKVCLDHDESNLLFRILGKSEYEDFDLKEIETRTIPSREESFCTAIVSFSDETENDGAEREKYTPIGFDKYEIVYNKTSWYRLRQQILAYHPGDSGLAFGDGCRKYFQNLSFSEECFDNIADYYLKSSKKIIYYLACINDRFHSFYWNHPLRTDSNTVLAEFSGKYKFDTAGSLGRKMQNREELTFTFYDCKRYCDPHFKIEHFDNTSDDNNGNPHCRIYLNFGIENEPTIYIGRVGCHAR